MPQTDSNNTPYLVVTLESTALPSWSESQRAKERLSTSSSVLRISGPPNSWILTAFILFWIITKFRLLSAAGLGENPVALVKTGRPGRLDELTRTPHALNGHQRC